MTEIPLTFNLPSGVANGGALNAGTQTSGTLTMLDPATNNDTRFKFQFPDPKQRPRGVTDITRIYLPILVFGTATTTPVSEASYELTYDVRGQIRWSHAGTVTQSGGLAGIGGDVISDDLVNPIRMQFEEVGQLDYRISFDQAMASWNFYVGAQPSGFTPGAISVVYYPD